MTLLGNFERKPLGRDPTESASGAMQKAEKAELRDSMSSMSSMVVPCFQGLPVTSLVKNPVPPGK